tara:strand:- start:37 stop:321 length:285 start_codon:yes stop_codon:yes gene_type:complete
MATLEEQKELIKQIIRQLSGDVDEDIKLVPESILIGHGYMFCFQPSSKSFVKIYRNQKVYVIDENKNENKLLIYTSCGKIVYIDSDQVYYSDFD